MYLKIPPLGGINMAMSEYDKRGGKRKKRKMSNKKEERQKMN
jgi:hypothetical protein